MGWVMLLDALARDLCRQLLRRGLNSTLEIVTVPAAHPEPSAPRCAACEVYLSICCLSLHYLSTAYLFFTVAGW